MKSFHGASEKLSGRELARTSRGSIILLRVATGAIDGAWLTIEAPTLMQEAIDAEQARATQYLARIAASPELAGISIHTRVQSGVPAQCILEVAREQQVELIILGSHGETGFKRWVLGSVAQHVTRQSSVPVLVLHERGGVPTRLSANDTQPVRILVALDGSPLAEATLTPAAYLSSALSAPTRGALHLALVLQPHSPTDACPKGIIPAAMEQAEKQAIAYLDTITQRLSKGKLAELQLQVTSSVAIQKDVAETLIGMAETGALLESKEPIHGSYVLALTTHGRSGVERWVMGSVTERILGATILPLLIIRPRKTEIGEQGATVTKGKQGARRQNWVGLL